MEQFQWFSPHVDFVNIFTCLYQILRDGWGTDEIIRVKLFQRKYM